MLGAPRGSPGGPQGSLGASGALKVAPRGAGGQKKAKKKIVFLYEMLKVTMKTSR